MSYGIRILWHLNNFKYQGVTTVGLHELSHISQQLFGPVRTLNSETNMSLQNLDGTLFHWCIETANHTIHGGLGLVNSWDVHYGQSMGKLTYQLNFLHNICVESTCLPMWFYHDDFAETMLRESHGSCVKNSCDFNIA